MSGPLLQLEDVVKRYEAVEGPAVLRGVNLRLESAERVAIIGPSGSGKSTLLHIIGALLPPTSGRVLLEGNDLASLDPNQLAALRNRKVGFIFQAHHLLPQCSTIENVLLPTLVLRDCALRASARERAESLLERVGLRDRLEHRPAHLSGGECQRVAVVRALINRPKLLLADEPTGSLDGRSAEGLGELLCELNESESVTLVAVTHSDRLALRMERVLELRDGKLAVHPEPA